MIAAMGWDQFVAHSNKDEENYSSEDDSAYNTFVMVKMMMMKIKFRSIPAL